MLPEELKKGDKLTAVWLIRLVRAIVARTVNAGPGLRATRTPAGTTLSLAPQRRGGAGAAADFDFPWRVTAAPSSGGGFRIRMVRGRFLAVSSTASEDLPLSVRIPTGSLPTAATASGYVTLAINARFNEDTKKFSGVGGVVSYGAEVGTSGTFANIPVAKVTISGNAATVEQYLAGTITIPLFPPLKAVSDAVRGVAYNDTTGALTVTRGTGVAFDDTDSTQDDTLFTAVDEEI